MALFLSVIRSEPERYLDNASELSEPLLVLAQFMSPDSTELATILNDLSSKYTGLSKTVAESVIRVLMLLSEARS